MAEPMNTASSGITPLWIMCQRVLPAVYDDSLTYYEAVCKVVHKLNEVIDAYGLSGDAITQLQQAVEKLQKELDEWKNGGFKDYIADTVTEWVNTNLDFIFTQTVDQVFFGLTQDGYFTAYVPSSWNDIIFDTGAIFKDDTYGRLILRWDVDNVHPVNQTLQSANSKPHGGVVDDNNPRYWER